MSWAAMAAKGGPPKPVEKPQGYWGKQGNRDMGNLPATITVGGVTYHKTASQSKEGTYSYGHPDNSSGTIATTAHYTVVPVSKSSKEIYNIHYTDPGTGYRAYYYPGTNQWMGSDSKPIPGTISKNLKIVVDGLYFIWVWYKAA